MNVTPVRTHKITTKDTDILALVDRYAPSIDEGSVLAITSKIVSICEGSVAPKEGTDKQKLIERQADYFLPPTENRYRFTLTIKDNVMIPSAGIDESNVDGEYVLWPRDAQGRANAIWRHLRKRGVEKVGVVITDSRSAPLRWGVTGVCIAHCGFHALWNRAGTPDIFGRQLQFTRVNVADGLAASSVLVMGEADEQTPMGLVTDVPFVSFLNREPTEQELREQHISIDEDLYGTLLRSVDWRKGGGGG